MADSRSRISLSWIFVGASILGFCFSPTGFTQGQQPEGDYKGYEGVTPPPGGGSYVFGGGVELCGTDLSTFLTPPYGNLSNMICSPIWNTFILRYFQREDNVMTIILSAVYTTGWVGIGFSKNGSMVGSSSMVGWFSKKGHPKIKQYYLKGLNASQIKPNEGELLLVPHAPPVVALHGAMIYLAFQVQFPARLSRQPIILAFGTRYPTPHHLTKHDDRTSILFDFSQAASASVIYADSSSSTRRNHGILGIIAWGLILPIGAIIPRYFKHKDPLWYYLHAVIQFLGFVLGLANVLLGLQLYDKIKADIPAHKGIGIFVLVLSILQVLAFFLRPNQDSKKRKFWNWYHHWSGRMALFFAAINIVLGIHFAGAGNDWKIGYGFLVGIILVSVIVLETLSCLRRSKKPILHSASFQMNPI